MQNLMKTALKSTVIALMFSGLSATAMAQSTAPAQDKDNIEITPAIQTTKEEIAVVQVLSEICPDIIGKNDNFDQGYKRVLTDLLPGISDPVLAVQALSEESDYQPVLKQARQDAAKASREENRAVCLDVINWGKKSS